MPRSRGCLIKGCPNYGRSASDGGVEKKRMSLRSFPKDAELRAEWANILNIHFRLITNDSWLCALHFRPDDWGFRLKRGSRVMPIATPLSETRVEPAEKRRKIVKIEMTDSEMTPKWLRGGGEETAARKRRKIVEEPAPESNFDTSDNPVGLYAMFLADDDLRCVDAAVANTEKFNTSLGKLPFDKKQSNAFPHLSSETPLEQAEERRKIVKEPAAESNLGTRDDPVVSDTLRLADDDAAVVIGVPDPDPELTLFAEQKSEKADKGTFVTSEATTGKFNSLLAIQHGQSGASMDQTAGMRDVMPIGPPKDHATVVEPTSGATTGKFNTLLAKCPSLNTTQSNAFSQRRMTILLLDRNIEPSKHNQRVLGPDRNLGSLRSASETATRSDQSGAYTDQASGMRDVVRFGPAKHHATVVEPTVCYYRTLNTIQSRTFPRRRLTGISGDRNIQHSKNNQTVLGPGRNLGSLRSSSETGTRHAKRGTSVDQEAGMRVDCNPRKRATVVEPTSGATTGKFNTLLAKCPSLNTIQSKAFPRRRLTGISVDQNIQRSNNNQRDFGPRLNLGSLRSASETGTRHDQRGTSHQEAGTRVNRNSRKRQATVAKAKEMRPNLVNSMDKRRRPAEPVSQSGHGYGGCSSGTATVQLRNRLSIAVGSNDPFSTIIFRHGQATAQPACAVPGCGLKSDTVLTFPFRDRWPATHLLWRIMCGGRASLNLDGPCIRHFEESFTRDRAGRTVLTLNDFGFPFPTRFLPFPLIKLKEIILKTKNTFFGKEKVLLPVLDVMLCRLENCPIDGTAAIPQMGLRILSPSRSGRHGIDSYKSAPMLPCGQASVTSRQYGLTAPENHNVATGRSALVFPVDSAILSGQVGNLVSQAGKNNSQLRDYAIASARKPLLYQKADLGELHQGGAVSSTTDSCFTSVKNELDDSQLVRGSSSHWFCQTAIRWNSDKFESFTGVSKIVFEVLSKLLRDEYVSVMPASLRSSYPFIPVMSDWSEGCLFQLLVALQHQYPTWFIGRGFSMSNSCDSILLAFLSELLQPLVFWPATELVDYHFSTELKQRLESENATIGGILNIIDLNVADSNCDRNSWSATLVMVFNFVGAVKYRSRLYWWRNQGRSYAAKKRRHQEILVSCYESDLRPILERHDRKVLLSPRRFFQDGRSKDWLWCAGGDNITDGQRLQRFMSLIEKRMRKAFLVFMEPKSSFGNVEYTEVLVSICCGLMNLMRPIDISANELENYLEF